jgi:hypothetical protein
MNARKDSGESARHRGGTRLAELLQPHLQREIAGIAALDAAIPRERDGEYVLLFQAAKTTKQANVEQMSTLIRMRGEQPAESGGLKALVQKAQAGITERLSATTLLLRELRIAERDLHVHYGQALDALHSDALAKQSLQLAQQRTAVREMLLTAHIAHRTRDDEESKKLLHPLDAYFAGERTRACLRCHLDRAGAQPAIERGGERPPAYLCAACHNEVLKEFPPDIAAQAGQWPDHVREDRVMALALERPSQLNAFFQVLFPLTGLASPENPKASKRPLPAASAPPPKPDPAERPGVVELRGLVDAEAEYVRTLLGGAAIWPYW